MKLERILFKQPVYDPKSSGAESSKSFYPSKDGYVIDFDPSTGWVELSYRHISGAVKHNLVHVSLAIEARRARVLGDAESPVPELTPDGHVAPRSEAIKVGEGTFVIVPKVVPHPDVDDPDGAPVPIPPRKRGRPRKSDILRTAAAVLPD